MLAQLLQQFAATYPALKKQDFCYSDSTEIITSLIPDNLDSSVNQGDKYIIRGSVGQGNWAETPWVAILDKNVTLSTQNGYYVCFLINPIEQTMYLSLAVGWTQFASEYSFKTAKQRIREYSDYLRDQLKRVPKGFGSGPINLSATGQLSRGYEYGQILTKRYEINSINDSELLVDLREIIAVYNDLTSLVGSDIKNIDYEKVAAKEKVSDIDKAINQFTLIGDGAKALEELKKFIRNSPPEKRKVIAEKAVRNPKIARLIKESRKYVCEICGLKPFIQKSGEPYAEADHIKPLSDEGYDSADNMRCLCAQCHAIITHGSETEVERLMKR